MSFLRKFWPGTNSGGGLCTCCKSLMVGKGKAKVLVIFHALNEDPSDALFSAESFICRLN